MWNIGMEMENERSKRKLLRLQQFDYATHAYYFITICCKDKQHLLGRIVGAAYMPPVHVILSRTGEIAEKNLLAIEEHTPQAHIEKYVIMPNHLHMILSIGCMAETAAGGMYAAPTVPKIMNSYKASVSRAAGCPVWQRSYYDHVIRNQPDFEEIWQYIDNNPLQWVLDGKV